MGLYGSAPEVPDPKVTGAAQTQTNLSTAIGNSYLGNINQVTPDGALTYSQTGQNFVNDPLGQAYYYNKAKDTYDLNDAHKGQAGWDPVTGYYVPTFTATTTLSKDQQAIKNQEDAASLNLATLANHQSDRLDNILGKSLNLSDAPKAGNSANLNLPDYTAYKNGPNLQTNIADAGDITKSYKTNFDTSKYADALMARINPQLQQDSDALNAKLVNQGLQPGSEAYNRAFAQQGQKENDARYGAILNAGQEQSRLAGLAQQQATFQNAAQQQQYGQNANDASFANTGKQQMYQNTNTATSGNNALADQSFNADLTKKNAMDADRTQYLNEEYAKRNQSLNEITSLMSGAQVQSPNFVQTNGQTMPTVDYAGLVNQNYQNQLAAYQQNQAGIGQLLGGIGSIAALSDKRAKKDIKKVGKLKGQNLYEYSMRGARDDGKKHIGVMAQEVQKTRPDAVSTGDDGLKRVNYGALFSAGARKKAS